MVTGSCHWIRTQVNDQIRAEIDGEKISRLDEAKLLEQLIDKHLSSSSHIDSKSKKISSATGALNA